MRSLKILLPAVLLFTIFTPVFLLSQGVGINPTGQPPHPGAMLDVNAPNKGMLVPRTQSASVTNPAAGMIVYDTVDMQLELYNGMQWLPMMTGGASSFWWADADGDTYGDPFNVIYAPMAPPFFVANSDDCDDTDPAIKPTAPEICDGIDNDCDGLVDDDDTGVQGLLTFYQDLDGDGWGTPAQTQQACVAPPGYSPFSSDCDDNNADIYPGAPEYCNGIDDNCDGAIDEDRPVDAIAAWIDADEDAFGDAGADTSWFCSPPSGYALNNQDCNDADAEINPNAAEICDAIDNNCNGTVDEPTGLTCLIMGICYSAGQLNPDNACEVCDPVADNMGWTLVTCPAGLICCDGTCVDPTTDPSHCGDCGISCDDGIPCTIDVCNAGVCTTTIDPGTCFISGVCYNSGDPNPVAECQVCDPAVSQTGWTNIAAGTPCSTGICDGSGSCVECITGSECEDGLPCTIDICTGGVCTTELDPNTCFIAGVCYNSGDPNPMAECQVCDPAASQTGWTNAPAGSPCGAGGECDGNGNCN